MSFKKLLSLVLLSTLLLIGCKKGENDPFLSLRTRKSRVVGDWHISSGNSELSATEAGKRPYTERYIIKADDIKVIASYYAGPPITLAYALTVSFKKEGTVDVYEKIGTSECHATGTWDFSSGVGKGKSKTNLVLRISDISSGTIYNSLFCGFRTAGVYHIRELRDKKMVLEMTDQLNTDAAGYGTSIYSSFTFAQ